MKFLTVCLLSLFFFSCLVETKVFAQPEEDFSLPEIFEYPVTKGRDPFAPLIIEKKRVEEKKVVMPKAEVKAQPGPEKLPVITHSEYKLIGIVWYGEEAAALIRKNEKTWVVKEGMVFNGLSVARIEGEKGEVILLGKDKIIKLNMLEI